MEDLKSQPNCLNLDYVYKFGKYKGISLRDVIGFNCLYVNWCVNNVDGFVLTSHAEMFLYDMAELNEDKGMAYLDDYEFWDMEH